LGSHDEENRHDRNYGVANKGCAHCLGSQMVALPSIAASSSIDKNRKGGVGEPDGVATPPADLLPAHDGTEVPAKRQSDVEIDGRS